MGAKLKWQERELKLAGAFTVATVRPLASNPRLWGCSGATALGALLEYVWEDPEDAKQDIRQDVKCMPEAQGVEIDG